MSYKPCPCVKAGAKLYLAWLNAPEREDKPMRRAWQEWQRAHSERASQSAVAIALNKWKP